MSKEKYNFMAPLHLACREDDLRPVMECVHFINGYAYASDGSILCKSSIEDYCTVINKDMLNGHALHKDSYAAILKYEVADAHDDGVEAYDDGGKRAFFPYFKSEDWQVPNFDSVLEGFSAVATATFGIRPELFAIADRCIVRPKGTPLRCTHQQPSKPIIVQCDSYGAQLCAIMPCLIDDTLF